MSVSKDQSPLNDQHGFKHFMLKEIHDQPEVVQRCLDACLSEGKVQLDLPESCYTNLQQIQILACGTSLHAGLVGKYLLEQVVGIPTIVRSASDFVDAPSLLSGDTLTIAVTQSGETADTLTALQLQRQIAPSSGFLGMTNSPGSSLEQMVDHTLYTLAGAEVAIAATKTLAAQLTMFYCLTLNLAHSRQAIPLTHLQKLVNLLQQLPEQIQTVLVTQAHLLESLAQNLAELEGCILLGRGINYPIALEGALKFKETSYLHAEGYLAGEFLHGPVAMLDRNIPVIAIAMPGQVYQRVLTNLQKVKARGSRIIGVTSVEDAALLEGFDDVLLVPSVDELFSPLLTVIPLQLLAYHIAVRRGLNVDRPRDLRKSLTGSF